MLTSGLILPDLRLLLNWVTNLWGLLCSPKMSPLTWIREPSAQPSGSSSTPASFNRAFTSTSGTSSETSIICAPFFTKPQFCPSGVSFGHNLPHWVGWRSRASKCGWLLTRGLVTLLRCERADRYVVLSRSWLTPDLPPTQLPVASACMIFVVRTSGLRQEDILSSLFLLWCLSSWYFRSLANCWRLTLNRSSTRSPASLTLLFA